MKKLVAVILSVVSSARVAAPLAVSSAAGVAAVIAQLGVAAAGDVSVAPGVVATTPQVIPQVWNDDSPPLRDIVPLPPPADGAHEMRRHRSPRPIGAAPEGAAGAPSVASSAATLGADSAVQAIAALTLMPSPDVSFDGLANPDGVLPPDPNGAVGPNHYVQWVNLSFAVYDKAGALLYGPAAGNTLWAGFGGPCESQNDGDPIVLHDHQADRWVMSQLALPYFPFGPFYQCVAVSQTPDPTGAWHRYAFRVSDTKLNDYPKLGVWSDAYYLTVNEFEPFTDTFLGQGVAAFERDQMLAGLPASMVVFDLSDVDPTLGGMLPADLDGPAPPAGAPAYFVQVDDDGAGAPQDQLQLWRFHVDWDDPAASTFSGPAVLATAAFDSSLCDYALDCIPQPGTIRRLSALSDRLMYRLQYRNFGTHDSLTVNHTVDVGGDHAGIRWYEVRDPGGAPFIYQQGTYAPDGDHRWMGSAAMDFSGDLAVGFSVASTTTFPSVRYAGRLVDDPLGTLAQGEGTLVDGSGSQTDPSSRWGDYSALMVDPADQCTFWYTQEYYAATSAIGWRTRIGSFRFPSCAVDLPVVSVVATDSSATEAGLTPGAFSVQRTGNTDDELVVGYTVRGSATAGSDYVPLAGSVTIPAGAAAAAITVTPIDDTLVEDDEAVVVTLDADPAYLAGPPSTAVVTIVNDDLPPDLVIATMSVPTTGGAGATLTVSDTTTNKVGGGPAAASTTAFYLSANNVLDGGDVALGSRAVPPLAAGAASTAATALTIPAGTATGVYYVIAKADAGSVLDESQENNNTGARALVIGPDLAVAAVAAPPAAAAGETIAVTDTTKNQGGGSAAASTTVFYLSANSAFDAADVPLGSRAVPVLAAGATSAGSTSLAIPADTVAGAYYVIARADAAGAVAETKETNNTAADTIKIGADLAIAALSAPTTGGAGATITVGDTTKNQGGGSAGASTTAFYLSVDSAFDLGDAPLASRAVPVLGAGEASAGSTAVTIPPGTPPGLWYLVARADADGDVVESQEGNNVSSRWILVGADLAIAAVSVPTVGAPGATIAVTDTTKNQGGGSAGASTTAFYLSTNNAFDLGDVPLGSRAVPALAAGATSAATTSVAIPAGTAVGTYYVVARADAGDAVVETKETNNTGADTIQIGPDLAIATLSAPTSAGAGGIIAVGDSTKNQGGAGAAPSTTAFYLSTNTTLDAGDVPLGSRAVPALAAGTSSAGSTSVTIPADAVAGTYYIIARSDDGSAVAESQEGNNVSSRWVLVGPDLTVTALSAPAGATAGTVISVTETTKNTGGGAAPASVTAFYLSTNTAYDVDDVLLGARAVPALAAGAGSAASTVLEIPGWASGGYYIVARADADDDAIETKETNNTSARAIQITSGGPQ